MKCEVLRGLRKTSSTIKTLNPRKADVSFLMEKLGEISWETDLESKGGQEY